MDQQGKDMRFGLRMICKSPGFAAAAILTLALGIGGTRAIVSFVDAVLLKPLPFPGADQILNVWEKPPGGERNGISTLNFLDWKNQNTVFTAMAAQSWSSVTLTDADVPVELRNGRVSAPYFEIFGVKPMLGRTFAADEDQLGKNQVVILSHRVWQNRFGEDSNIISRTQALGSSLMLVLKTGIALTGAGLVIGVLGALGLTRILSSLLFGISPRDPWTLLFVSTVLAVVAVAGVLHSCRQSDAGGSLGGAPA